MPVGDASGTMSDGDEAYRFLISFGVNALGIKSLIKLANNLRFSTHRRCLCDFHFLVCNKPLYTPFLCVTFRQSSKFRRTAL